jgi:hypothetical protein
MRFLLFIGSTRLLLCAFGAPHLSAETSALRARQNSHIPSSFLPFLPTEAGDPGPVHGESPRITTTAPGRGRGAPRSYFPDKDNPGQGLGAFSCRQLVGVGGVAADDVVPLKLVEAAPPRGIIERDGLFAFALGQPFPPERRARGFSDPDFAWVRMGLVAEAKGGDFLAAVKEKRLVVSGTAWRVGVVSRHDLRNRVAAANLEVRHGRDYGIATADVKRKRMQPSWLTKLAWNRLALYTIPPWPPPATSRATLNAASFHP